RDRRVTGVQTCALPISTLIKTLSGGLKDDSGDILIDGQPATLENPRDAKRYGIETIYQTLALAENIDAPGNMLLGRELTTGLGKIGKASCRERGNGAG